VRVALAQIRLEPDKRSANLSSALRWIDEAADLTPAPDLICLPGSCDYGPSQNRAAAPIDSMGGPFAERIAAKARDLGLFIAMGHADADHGHAYLAASLFDPDGDAVLRHRGVVVPRLEPKELAQGTTLRVRDTLLGRVGLLLDADLAELCLPRALAAMGATLIIAAGCGLAVEGAPRSARQLGDLAGSLGAYLLVTQPVAAEPRAERTSAVFGPNGACIASAAARKEGLVTVDIPAPCRAARARA
jgi:predicted amidohydrolase